MMIQKNRQKQCFNQIGHLNWKHTFLNSRRHPSRKFFLCHTEKIFVNVGPKGKSMATSSIGL